jgi:wyosine [tRNA(Phe)-imidazoG37] synthetase (radical SAM superfamily)
MCTRLDRVKQGRLKVMDMEPKTINKILEQIKLFVKHDYPVIFAPMGLGEPLMYKNLFKLISDIKKISKKVRIVIVTNGVLLNPETSKKLVDLKFTKNLVKISNYYHQKYYFISFIHLS